MAERGACTTSGERLVFFRTTSQETRLRKNAPGKARRRAPSKTLQQAGDYLGELANSVPEHSEWLNMLANRLRREAASLKTKRAPRKREERLSEPQPIPIARTYEKRRRFPRKISAVLGQLYGNTGACKGLISELSEGGLKMATGLLCKVGDEVVVAWRFERDGQPFEVTGVVRYQTTDGIGIEFLDISPYDQLRIRQYCQELKSDSPAMRAASAD